MKLEFQSMKLTLIMRQHSKCIFATYYFSAEQRKFFGKKAFMLLKECYNLLRCIFCPLRQTIANRKNTSGKAFPLLQSSVFQTYFSQGTFFSLKKSRGTPPAENAKNDPLATVGLQRNLNDEHFLPNWTIRFDFLNERHFPLPSRGLTVVTPIYSGLREIENYKVFCLASSIILIAKLSNNFTI